MWPSINIPSRLLLLVAALGLGACESVVSNANGSGGNSNTGLTPAQHEMYFPITSGAHAGVDCNTCHGSFASFKEFTCFGCHAHDQAVTDPGHVAVTGYSYQSSACYTCHPTGVAGGISRVQHEMYFPIAAGAHSTAACTTCHTNPASKKDFSCIGCHEHDQAVMDPGHAGVTNYMYQSSACYTCHPTGVSGAISRVQHDPFFPVSTGSHATVLCVDCHMDLTRPTDLTTMGCIGCHTGNHAQATMGTRHAMPSTGDPGVGSIYTWTQTSCLDCHAHDIVVTRAVHPMANGGSAAFISDHSRAQCSQCHPSSNFAVAYPQNTCHPCHAP